MWTHVSSCKDRNENLLFLKYVEYLTEWLFASQEGLSFVEVIRDNVSLLFFVEFLTVEACQHKFISLSTKSEMSIPKIILSAKQCVQFITFSIIEAADTDVSSYA